MSAKKIYLQPVPVRIWHWLNALGIITLALTGAQIRYPEYVSMFATYRTAITLHNVAGIVVALSFSIWFFYYKIVAGTLANIYVPKKDDLTHGPFPAGGILSPGLFLRRAQPAPCQAGRQVQPPAEIGVPGRDVRHHAARESHGNLPHECRADA